VGEGARLFARLCKGYELVCITLHFGLGNDESEVVQKEELEFELIQLRLGQATNLINIEVSDAEMERNV